MSSKKKDKGGGASTSGKVSKKKQVEQEQARLIEEAQRAEELEVQRQEAEARQKLEERSRVAATERQRLAEEQARLVAALAFDARHVQRRNAHIKRADERAEQAKLWQQYLECNPLPDVTKENSINTYLSEWRDADMHAQPHVLFAPVVDSCATTEQVIAMLHERLAVAREQRNLFQIQRSLFYILSLRELARDKLDQLAVSFLARSDEYEDEENKTVTVCHHTPSIDFGLWVHNSAKHGRIKRIDFPSINVSIELPVALQKSRTSIRLTRTKYDGASYRPEMVGPLIQADGQALEHAPINAASHASSAADFAVYSSSSFPFASAALASTAGASGALPSVTSPSTASAAAAAAAAAGGPPHSRSGVTSPHSTSTFASSTTSSATSTAPGTAAVGAATTIGSPTHGATSFSATASSTAHLHITPPTVHFISVGGVLNIEQLALPPPPKYAKGWTMRDITPLTTTVQLTPYPAEESQLGSTIGSASLTGTTAPSSLPTLSNTISLDSTSGSDAFGGTGPATGAGAGGGASANANANANANQAPLRVSLSIPPTVFLEGREPHFGWWDARAHSWRQDGVSLIQYDVHTGAALLSLNVLKPVAIIQPRALDFPYRSWSLVPDVQLACASYLRLKGSRFEVTLHVREGEARLLHPTATVLAPLNEQYHRPGALLAALHSMGINIQPTVADAQYCRKPLKHSLLTSALHEHIAHVAGVFDVRSMEHNSSRESTVCLFRVRLNGDSLELVRAPQRRQDWDEHAAAEEWWFETAGNGIDDDEDGEGGGGNGGRRGTAGGGGGTADGSGANDDGAADDDMLEDPAQREARLKARAEDEARRKVEEEQKARDDEERLRKQREEEAQTAEARLKRAAEWHAVMVRLWPIDRELTELIDSQKRERREQKRRAEQEREEEERRLHAHELEQQMSARSDVASTTQSPRGGNDGGGGGGGGAEEKEQMDGEEALAAVEAAAAATAAAAAAAAEAANTAAALLAAAEQARFASPVYGHVLSFTMVKGYTETGQVDVTPLTAECTSHSSLRRCLLAYYRTLTNVDLATALSVSIDRPGRPEHPAFLPLSDEMLQHQQAVRSLLNLTDPFVFH